MTEVLSTSACKAHTIGSQITTMCTVGCAFYAEVDRPSVIDALDDIFLKIQKKLVFVIDDL